MRGRTRSALFVALGLVVLLFLAPSGQAISDGIQEVFITNFPAVWTVEGDVRIDEPVTLSKPVVLREILVPPTPRTETTRWVDAGSVVADGFAHVVLSLHGEVKGDVNRPGTVGAVLLPEESSIKEAFDEFGLVHFGLEVHSSGVSAKTPYFSSNQPRYTVGFRSYRVLLYNGTDKTVTADVFAYLTN